jgi:hypothetical protein
MPILLRWVLGTVLALVFVVVAAGNAWTVIRYIVNKRRSSAVPLVGGLCGVAACFVLPLGSLTGWWWLPLLLDYGSLPVFAVSAVLGVVAMFREST